MTSRRMGFSVATPTEELWKRTYAIALLGGTALAGTEGGIAVWDVSDRRSPRLAGYLVLSSSVSSLTVLDPGKGIIAAATGPTGVAIVQASTTGEGRVDLLSGGAWASLGGCAAAWAVRGAAGDKAYIACGSSGIAEADLSDPAHPRIVRTLDTDGYVRDVTVIWPIPGAKKPKNKQVGTLIAAAGGSAGVVLAEFPQEGPPRVMAELDTDGEARAVVSTGGSLWVADGPKDLLVARVSGFPPGLEPFLPSLVAAGGLDIDATDMSRGIAIDGARVYLCMGDSGLSVIDVTDPAAPRCIGGYDPDRTLNGVTVAGNVAFLGNDDGGILILDMADPASPVALFPAK